MTKDAQIEKEETLKKVLSGELDDSYGSQTNSGLVLSQLTCKVGPFSFSHTQCM